MGAFRAGAVLTGFAALTIPLLPVQQGLLRFSTRHARRFPHWYHRQVCRLLGIRLHIEGNLVSNKPVLIVANHTTWLDIPVLSAVAPVSFVAKKEVARWPGVSLLARLQRTVFIDRDRRGKVADSADEIRSRLKQGDTLVLFAEGTSSDGSRVLPFKSSLFAAALPSTSTSGGAVEDTQVQTVTLAYTRLHGIPIGRAERPIVSWYGDMEMLSHAWGVLKAGPLDVQIHVGEPVSLQDFKSRKELARHSEDEVRQTLARILRVRAADESFDVVEPSLELRKSSRSPRAPDQESAKWV